MACAELASSDCHSDLCCWPGVPGITWQAWVGGAAADARSQYHQPDIGPPGIIAVAARRVRAGRWHFDTAGHPGDMIWLIRQASSSRPTAGWEEAGQTVPWVPQRVTSRASWYLFFLLFSLVWAFRTGAVGAQAGMASVSGQASGIASPFAGKSNLDLVRLPFLLAGPSSAGGPRSTDVALAAATAPGRSPR